MSLNRFANFAKKLLEKWGRVFGWRRTAELAFVFVLAILLNIFGYCIYWTVSWRELPREGTVRKWQRGNATHIDENGDGRVDEEILMNPKTHRRTVRRDSDHDGWFDVEYEHGRYGIAMKLQQIHERAPCH